MARDTSHIDKTREKIKSSQLVNRLLKYIEADPQAENEKERPGAIMTAHQCNVALALIKKIVPDVAQQQVAVEHTFIDKPVRTLSLEDLTREWQSTREQLNGGQASTH